ncbi:hypothetical protein ACMFMG_001112 [Clarireedia jacksonii]
MPTYWKTNVVRSIRRGDSGKRSTSASGNERPPKKHKPNNYQSSNQSRGAKSEEEIIAAEAANALANVIEFGTQEEVLSYLKQHGTSEQIASYLKMRGNIELDGSMNKGYKNQKREKKK